MRERPCTVPAFATAAALIANLRHLFASAAAAAAGGGGGGGGMVQLRPVEPLLHL